jgi:hypothetical protein
MNPISHHVSQLLISAALLCSASAAGAAESFTFRAGNTAHVAPVEMPDGSLAAISESLQGAFTALRDVTTCGDCASPLGGGAAIGGKGLSAITSNGYVYVFEIEDSGLWYGRSSDSGSTWSGWCHVDANPDLGSAPAAVAVGSGVVVFAQTSTSPPHMLMWTINDPTPTCAEHWSQGSPFDLGLTIAAPVAVSWGTDRYDLFGEATNGRLAHWWNSSAIEAPGNYGYQDSYSLTTGGTQSFQVAAVPNAISAVGWHSLTYQNVIESRLDVLFRENGFGTGDTIQHLYWRNGWSLEPFGYGNSSVLSIGVNMHNVEGTDERTWWGTVCDEANLEGSVDWSQDSDNISPNGETFTCEPSLTELRSVAYLPAGSTQETGYVFGVDSSGDLFSLMDQ